MRYKKTRQTDNILTFKYNDMLDLTKYSETNKTITFSNGNTFKVYSKETKAGVRYYYYSMPRMIQVSKKDIK